MAAMVGVGVDGQGWLIAIWPAFRASGGQVALNGGGGGTNCCKAQIDGTLLAPLRNIALAPGLVNGAVISSKSISIVSGASVRCLPCIPG